MSLLEIRESPGRGRGLFAKQKIPSRTTIEVSPVLVLDAQSWRENGQHTVLNHYCFVWRDQPRGSPVSMALALGMGSIFNHRKDPSVGWVCDIDSQVIRYITLREVEEGEELFICYGRDLWFTDTDAGEVSSEENEEDFKCHLAALGDINS